MSITSATPQEISPLPLAVDCSKQQLAPNSDRSATTGSDSISLLSTISEQPRITPRDAVLEQRANARIRKEEIPSRTNVPVINREPTTLEKMTAPKITTSIQMLETKMPNLIMQSGWKFDVGEKTKIEKLEEKLKRFKETVRCRTLDKVCQFPGYRRDRVIALPHGVNISKVMYTILSKQLKPLREKFYKPVDWEVMKNMSLDLFWLHFLKIQGSCEDKKKNFLPLLNRIAQNYVILLEAIQKWTESPIIKEKFLQAYISCFPSSKNQFDKKFATNICNYINEVFTGISVDSKQCLKSWDLSALQKAKLINKEEIQLSQKKNSKPASREKPQHYNSLLEHLTKKHTAEIRKSLPLRDSRVFMMELLQCHGTSPILTTWFHNQLKKNVYSSCDQHEMGMDKFMKTGIKPLHSYSSYVNQSTDKSDETTFRKVINSARKNRNKRKAALEFNTKVNKKKILEIQDRQRSENHKIDRLQKELLQNKGAVSVLAATFKNEIEIDCCMIRNAFKIMLDEEMEFLQDKFQLENEKQ